MDAVTGSVKAAKMKEKVDTRDLREESEHSIDLLNQCTTEMTNEFAHCKPQLTETQYLKVTGNDFRSWADFHNTTGIERGSQAHTAVISCMYEVHDKLQAAQRMSKVEDYDWYSSQTVEELSKSAVVPPEGVVRRSSRNRANSEVKGGRHTDQAGEVEHIPSTQGDTSRTKRRKVSELVSIHTLNQLTESGDISMFRQIEGVQDLALQRISKLCFDDWHDFCSRSGIKLWSPMFDEMVRIVTETPSKDVEKQAEGQTDSDTEDKQQDGVEDPEEGAERFESARSLVCPGGCGIVYRGGARAKELQRHMLTGCIFDANNPMQHCHKDKLRKQGLTQCVGCQQWLFRKSFKRHSEHCAAYQSFQSKQESGRAEGVDTSIPPLYGKYGDMCPQQLLEVIEQNAQWITDLRWEDVELYLQAQQTITVPKGCQEQWHYIFLVPWHLWQLELYD